MFSFVKLQWPVMDMASIQLIYYISHRIQVRYIYLHFWLNFMGKCGVNALYMDPMDTYRFILSNISILYKSITSLLLEKKHVGHTNNECSFNNLVICFGIQVYQICFFHNQQKIQLVLAVTHRIFFRVSHGVSVSWLEDLEEMLSMESNSC